MPTIALLTDFGARGWFVASVKGVILRIAPQVSIVDISHEIPPQDLESAAFSLVSCYRWFPADTVFVAVVDPGVGSSRKAIAARAGQWFFVGPDNGVLSWVFQKEAPSDIRSLENMQYFLAEVSTTFHGRDIFAPVAAHLGNGVALENFGPQIQQYTRLPFPPAAYGKYTIEGRVIYIDYFGNAITNIGNEALSKLGTRRLNVQVKNLAPFDFGGCYADGRPGIPIAVPGSSGFLEIAVPMGNAAKALGIGRGDAVKVKG
jgi:S-adenosylmethionine hydrolase